MQPETRDPHAFNREYISRRFNGGSGRALEIYDRTVRQLEETAAITKYIPLLAFNAAMNAVKE